MEKFNYIVLTFLPRASIIQFFAVIAAAATIGIIFKYRKAPEVKYLIYIIISAAVWSFTYGMEFISSNTETKILWSKISYFGIAFIPVFYYHFAKAFSQPTYKIKIPDLALLSIIPFLTIVLVLTNEHHNLIWTSVIHDQDKNMLLYEYGFWFRMFWLYSILLICLGLFNLIRSFLGYSSQYKAQVIILILATLVPLMGNLMYIVKINPLPGFDSTPVLFVFSGIVITIGTLSFGMFELIPYARNKLIDTMDDGVLVINSKGLIEDHNPSLSDIFNLNIKSIVQKQFNEVFSQYPELINSAKGNDNKQFNLELKNNGERNFYQVLVSPLLNQKNILSGHLIQIHNITSLKLGEEKLKDTNRNLLEEIEQRGKLIDDLDAFAHTIAHDLRNSLGSIYSSSEVIKEHISEISDSGFLTELSDLIKNAAQKAMHITEELLILATVRNERIETKPLIMANIFKEAVNQLAVMIREYNVQIKTPDSWPDALGHAPWVEEVWVNYISNAIKYGGTPPQIEVGADQQTDNFIKFWIKDNGNGITKQEQTKLFKKYARLAPEKAHGYGLGLSIVKRIIDKLGGRVGVESTGNPGKGAKFWFELPVI